MPLLSKIKRFLIYLFFLAALLPISRAAADDSKMYLEGILYESKNPSQSLASINGVLVKKGDTLDDFTVQEIRETQVVLLDSNGKEKVLHITGNRAQAPKAIPSPTSHAPSAKASASEDPAKALSNLPNALSGNSDLMGKMVQKMAEIQILIEMKNLRNHAVFVYGERGLIPTIQNLVDDGTLPPSFKDGIKNGYQYSFGSGSKGDPVIYADPVEQNSPKPHYMLDEWGETHVENGKRASLQSPTVQMGSLA